MRTGEGCCGDPGAPLRRFLFLRRSLALVLAALEVFAPGNPRGREPPMSESLERLAHNQSVFSEVSERIENLAEVNERIGYLAEDATSEFVCECSNLECTETIELNLKAYERVRSNPTWFVIKPGHDSFQIARIISQDDGYTVVEKLILEEWRSRIPGTDSQLSCSRPRCRLAKQESVEWDRGHAEPGSLPTVPLSPVAAPARLRQLIYMTPESEGLTRGPSAARTRPRHELTGVGSASPGCGRGSP